MKYKHLKDLTDDQIIRAYTHATSTQLLADELGVQRDRITRLRYKPPKFLRNLLAGMEPTSVIDPELLAQFPPIVNSSNRPLKRIEAFLRTIYDHNTDMTTRCWHTTLAKQNMGMPMFSGLDVGERPNNGPIHSKKGRPVTSGVGRMMLASRFCYELFVGPIEQDLDLCHSEYCETHKHGSHKACINPHHLTPDTHEQNVEDAWEWGSFNGKFNNLSLRSRETVREIFMDVDTPRWQLSKKHGVTISHIVQIQQGTARTHITADMVRPKAKRHPRQKITKEHVDFVLANMGKMTINEMALHLETSNITTIYRITVGKYVYKE